uniref:Uncharacterized protein n=1 Tax=Rhizophora mucronata TaxID=61149 RepID=A0A2P2R3Y0_RHIMU
MPFDSGHHFCLSLIQIHIHIPFPYFPAKPLLYVDARQFNNLKNPTNNQHPGPRI